MVQMSLRIKAILLPVKTTGKRRLARLRSEFGERLRIVLRGRYIRIECDELRDYRIRDRIYEIAGGV